MNKNVDAALHAVFEANRILRDAGEHLAAAAGQTHSRRMILQAAGEGATVPDIARRLGLQRQSVQRVADELVHEGLARYEDNPQHRRSQLLVVTKAGDAALAVIHRAHAKWVDDIEAAVGPLDWAALRAGLERITRAVRDQDAPVSVTSRRSERDAHGASRK
ncbi:Transcriptional regulator, MarR family [Labilithrix luteola]|uniref:Transcriptional regulator, MarR family n=1 Tax=Labilithrix luteola TaxID=1391654 RepID=A0A0K1PQE1_9BACT|nr:MarR family transcriptional regulator [Labilithrix luteola]AKU95737.1 Transcriptional regulator, MarR family [Labilithrix luteola]